MSAADARAVLVTGAATGIGAACVAELARREVRVLAVDRDGGRLAEVVAAAGDGVVAHTADVTVEAQVADAFAAAVEEFGGLDGVFNNAGILGTVAPLERYSSDDYRRVLEVNVLGVFHGVKHAIPVLRARGGGAIVNTASTGALIGAPEQPAYVSSKHAVLGLTRSAALELAGEGIRVNALCPGATDTAMLQAVMEGWRAEGPDAVQAVVDNVTPTGRMGRPEEMGAVAAWLLLDAPSYLTGAPIPVDGAQTAR